MPDDYDAAVVFTDLAQDGFELTVLEMAAGERERRISGRRRPGAA